MTGLSGVIQRCPVDSPHKGPVTRKMFPFDDVIMTPAKYKRVLIVLEKNMRNNESEKIHCINPHHNGPFYQHGLTLIPAWISNHTHSKDWDGITYPFQTSTVAPLKFWNGWVFHPAFYNGCNYLYILRIKLNRVSNKGPRSRSCYVSHVTILHKAE